MLIQAQRFSYIFWLWWLIPLIVQLLCEIFLLTAIITALWWLFCQQSSGCDIECEVEKGLYASVSGHGPVEEKRKGNNCQIIFWLAGNLLCRRWPISFCTVWRYPRDCRFHFFTFSQMYVATTFPRSTNVLLKLVRVSSSNKHLTEYCVLDGVSSICQLLFC